MEEEYEEVAPYEEWPYGDLRKELTARNLNNDGKKNILVERLYRDDEKAENAQPEEIINENSEPNPEAVEAPIVQQGWIDGDTFFVEHKEKVPSGIDFDFGSVPGSEDHFRLLAETYNIAILAGNNPRGGVYDGSLVSKVLVGDEIVYRYALTIHRSISR